MIKETELQSYSLGYQSKLVFAISQHSRDKQLMEYFTYLGCGRYEPNKKIQAGNLIVTKLSDITQISIPFFKKYPIIGVKAKDFKD
jgi:hypothetical protein